MPHIRPTAWSIVMLAAVATPAQAHHAMGGETPQTLWQGLASGFAHPVIGVDHLLFLIAVAVFAMLADAGRLRMVFGFVGASLVGTSFHIARMDLPYGEAWIAATMLVAAVGLSLPRLQRPALAIVFCVVAGTLHGYAYGESIVGSEPTPLVAYLLGLATVQGVLASAIVVVGRRLRHALGPLPTARATLPAAATFTGLYGLHATLLA